MNSRMFQKRLYRVFCAVSLMIGIYLVLDLLISRTLDVKMIIVFILLLIVIFWSVADKRLSEAVIRNQEKELKLYQLYIQPMEELVKEIRARQHEFDNHINAILNMHLTVKDYDELVERQSVYIHEIRRDCANKYLPLLQISDKVMAGFLYSKIVSAPENIETDVEIRNREVISGASEHCLIEIIGVLVDNAYEATAKNGGSVKMRLDSRADKMVFEIFNQYPKLSFEEIGKFFEYGYSTKEEMSYRRGVGLNRIKGLIEKAGGEITVGQETTKEENYIHFTVVI